MMPTDNSSVESAAALSAEQEAMLAVILDMIIPASADGKLPSAAETGFGAYAQQAGILSWIGAGLQQVAEAARQAHAQEFATLTIEQQTTLVDGLKRKLFRFFGDLTSQVMQCYYQHDKVLIAIGLEARSPFPLGYFPIDGDLSLLEAVYERGQVYREVN
jgi:hypothetical protein